MQLVLACGIGRLVVGMLSSGAPTSRLDEAKKMTHGLHPLAVASSSPPTTTTALLGYIGSHVTRHISVSSASSSSRGVLHVHNQPGAWASPPRHGMVQPLLAHHSPCAARLPMLDTSVRLT
jgi:hypothetical protein